MPSRDALESYGKGRDLADRGEATQALPYLEKAALSAPEFAPAILNYGWTLSVVGDARALPTFMWARATARDSGDWSSETQSLVQLALLARRGADNEFLNAETLLKEALSIGVACGDTDLQAQVLNELGVHWINREDYLSAERVLTSALEMATRSGNHLLRSPILVNLANLAKYRGRSADARTLYLEAISEAAALENLWLEAVNWNNLALLDLEEGQSAAAEQTLQKVLQLRRRLGDVEGEHRVLLNLGIAAFMRRDFDQATTQFETTLVGARNHDLAQVQGRALYRLGDVLRARGKLAEASLRLQESLDPLRKTGTPGNQAAALAALAECRARQWEFAEAKRLLDEARRIAGNRPQIWRAWAWIQHQQGRNTEAVDSLALALVDPGREDSEHHEETRTLMSAWRDRH
jgi:tetratricopeptide (TPR) repeat protein